MEQERYGLVRVYLWVKVADGGRTMRRRTIFQKHALLDDAKKTVAEFAALNPTLKDCEAVFVPNVIAL